MANDRSSIMIVAIVSIVAMVGLIMLFMNNGGGEANLTGQAFYSAYLSSGSIDTSAVPTEERLFFEDKAIDDRAEDFDEKKDGIDSSISDGDVSKVTLGICGDGICSEGEEISCSADCKLLAKAT